jgi:hypothetical protein
MYLAVALSFITSLFSLYRLSELSSICAYDWLNCSSRVDWWPAGLGGRTSYALCWTTTLLAGLTAHHLDLFNLRERWEGRDPANEVDWERKSELSRPCQWCLYRS